MKKLVIAWLCAVLLLPLSVIAADPVSPPTTTPTVPTIPPPPPIVFDLTSCWQLNLQKGSIIDASHRWVQEFNGVNLMVCLEPGQENPDGMTQSYQGSVAGFPGSWVSVYYHNVVPKGQRKYMEWYLYLPEQQFGERTPGYHFVIVKLFVSRIENYAWGAMNAFHVEGGSESGLPDSLSQSTATAQKNFGGGKG